MTMNHAIDAVISGAKRRRTPGILLLMPPLMKPVHALARHLRAWRDARATRHALERLDDRMLKDIGVDRCEIQHRAEMLARDHRPWPWR